jgi:YggT family protein
MNPQIAAVFTTFLTILIICIIIRSLMTWFPQARNNQFGRLLDQIVEPLVAPVRNILPQTGMIDFSALVVIVILYIMIAVVNQAAAQ